MVADILVWCIEWFWLFGLVGLVWGGVLVLWVVGICWFCLVCIGSLGFGGLVFLGILAYGFAVV